MKNEEDLSFSFPSYPRGWKLLRLNLLDKPKGVVQLLRLIWGFDIFILEVPFLKSLCLANLIVWIIFKYSL